MNKIFAETLSCMLLLSLMGHAACAQSSTRQSSEKAAVAPAKAAHDSDAKKQQPLPTGMSITPTAAPGSKLLFLNPDLPGMPEFLADHPISTALSPDGRTLLVLTSGFNRNYDIK